MLPSRRTLLTAAAALGVGCLAALDMSLLAEAQPRTPPTPPGQPARGPGGADYAYPRAVRHDFGEGSAAVSVFVPEGARKAPVVFFLHGWGATDPAFYGAWIEHIVRRGAIVIYPAYQDSLRTPRRTFPANALLGARDAMARLRSGSLGVRPDEARAAYVGHSMGGVLAVKLALEAPGARLPAPRAVMCAMPGGDLAGQPDPVLGDPARLPAGVLLVALAGDTDQTVGDATARRIWREATGVPDRDKAFVMLHGDAHGLPALVAGHRAPAAATPGATLGLFSQPPADGPGGLLRQRLRERIRERLQERDGRMGPPLPELIATVDALDWYGIWKLFDGLTDAAFYGRNRAYALGGGPEQTFMGRWSDGTPVTPMTVERVSEAEPPPPPPPRPAGPRS